LARIARATVRDGFLAANRERRRGECEAAAMAASCVEVHPCAGHCCEAFTLPVSPGDLEAMFFEWLRIQSGGPRRPLLDSRWKLWSGPPFDIEVIATMAVPLGEFPPGETPHGVDFDFYFALRGTYPESTWAPLDSKHWYTCRYFDRRSRLCMVYDERPNLCVEHGRRLCGYRQCTRVVRELEVEPADSPPVKTVEAAEGCPQHEDTMRTQTEDNAAPREWWADEGGVARPAGHPLRDVVLPGLLLGPAAVVLVCGLTLAVASGARDQVRRRLRRARRWLGG